MKVRDVIELPAASRLRSASIVRRSADRARHDDHTARRSSGAGPHRGPRSTSAECSISLSDGIGIRRTSSASKQAGILHRSARACSSIPTTDTFIDGIANALVEDSATIAFDAISSGRLTANFSPVHGDHGRRSARMHGGLWLDVRQQVYIYGRPRRSSDRRAAFGLTWVWRLATGRSAKIGPPKSAGSPTCRFRTFSHLGHR